MLMALDVVCNLIYPAHETLYWLHKNRQERTFGSEFTHWTTYWIFYTLLYYVQKMLYFFPFIYELKVLIVLLMAHPKIEAATIVSQFLVTNPLILISVQDKRNRIKLQLDEALTKLKSFEIK